MRAHVLPLALVLLPFVAGCDDLSPFASGVCGNRVVDPNEDCDTFAAGPGTLCRPPGSPGECRFACGMQPDRSIAKCPAGMGCGADGTCRSPSGRFAAPTQPVAGHFSEILVGDVDGDGRADVVAVDPTDYSVSFFDGMLAVASTFEAARGGNGLVLPILRDLAGSGRADLLDSVGGGTLINLGSADRAFVPTACPSVTIRAETNVRAIAIQALPSIPGDVIMAVGSVGSVSGLAVLAADGKGQLFAVLPGDASMIAGPIVVGRFDEDDPQAPCDELALAFVGGADVFVYKSCKPDGMGGFTYNIGASPTSVALVGMATVTRGPILLDVNGDGHVDLVVIASSCSSCHEVQVAYGVGDGTFHSDPKTIPATSGDNAFSQYPSLLGSLPLALGDLNRDGILDQVTDSEVLVSSIGAGGGVTYVKQAQNAGPPWTEAVIADLNHDGVLDVFAGSSQVPNVSFYQGVGDAAGTLNPFSIPTHGPVAHFTVGDFDGDLVNDIALAELAVAGSGDTFGDSMSVLFGRPVGAPQPPIGMGQFSGIQQIVRARFEVQGVVYGVDDLLTAAVANGQTLFGSFPGRGDRILRSPLLVGYADSMEITSSSPWRYAIGRFPTADGPLGVAAVGTQTIPSVKTPIYRVWLIPTDGQRRLATQFVGSSDTLPAALDWTTAAIGAVDLDGDGVDELVALGPAVAPDTTNGVLAVAHVAVPSTAMPGDPTRIFQFEPPTVVDARVSRSEQDVIGGSQTGRLRVVDLDGDGRPDVVAIATIADSSGGAPSPHVVVFWNDQASPLARTSVVPNPNGMPVVDFTLLGANGTANVQLAVLTGEGVFFPDFAGRRATTSSSPAVAWSGQWLIAAGDVDGDGVDDIVLANGAGFVVFRGQPVRP
jgi:hypothetical protein